MTKLVPVQDPALLQQLNGASPPTDGQPAPDQPATFLGGTAKNWMDQIPSALTAIGGLGGAALGAAAGMGPGSVPGAIGGGTLGSAGGNYAGDLILNVLKRTGVYQGGQEKPVGEMIGDAAKTGALDAGLSMGMPIVGKGYQAGKSAILGVGQQGIDAFRSAGEQGINLGLSDVAQRALPRMYERVIGSFPFTGGPIRKNFDRKVGEVDKASQGIINSTGDARGISESGREMFDAAGDTYKAFRSQVDEKYTAARQMAEGASLSTDNLKRTAQNLVGEWDSKAVEGVSRAEPAVVAKAREILGMPETLTFRQYEGMADELDRLLELSRRDNYNFKQSLDVAGALKADLGSLTNPEAKRAFDEADQFFAAERQKFDTVTGKQFGRVDRNVFRPGYERPGNLNPDELFTRAFDTKSPQAMKELKNLVGDEAFGNALASHIERKLSGATSEQVVKGDPRQVLSSQKAGEALGFANPKSPEFAALQAAFNVAGRPDGVRALKQFLEAVAAATERGAPNVSQFLARRGALGGVEAIKGALPIGATLGAAEVGGPRAALGTILGFVAANRLSHRLSDPKFLREMAIILDPKNPAEFREAMMSRVFPAQIATPIVPNPMDQNGR